MNKILLKTALVVISIVFSLPSMADSKAWWGYYNDVNDLTPYGIGTATTYNGAMYVSNQHPIASGKKINAIRFYLQSKTNIKDIKVWVSKNLPSTADQADVVVTTNFQDLNEGFNDIDLETPYTISGNGVYVGYSFTITNSIYTTDRTPMVLTKNRPEVERGLYLKTGNGDWSNESLTGKGNLALKVQLEGEFMTYAAAVPDFAPAMVLKQESHQAKVFLTNCGTKNIEEFDYILTVDGVEAPEKHYVFTKTLKNIGYTAEAIIPIEAGDNTGRKAISIKVTKINGKSNELNSEGKSELFVLAQKVNKKIVEEEFTGTWCGWCPRGMKGMELSEQIFGDNYLGIAVHYNDIMECEDYYRYVIENVSGFPYCTLNRAIAPDTYYNVLETGYGLDAHITEEMGKLTPATLEVHPYWTDENKKSITVNTDINFQLNLEGQTPYALAYVMVADSLEGRGSDWKQKNYYSGDSKYANDEYLAEYYNAPKEIVDIVYNHVAIAGWNIGTTQTGKLNGTFREGEPKTITFTADLSSNKFINNSSDYSINEANIHLIALLIDTNSREIVNADRANLTVLDPTGIRTIEENRIDDNAIYNINGQKMGENQSLPSGIYIRNGKKFIVK